MQANPDFMVSPDRKGKQPTYMVKVSRKEATSPLINQAWKRPEQGWTKVNFDASYLQDNSSGSCGAIARTHDGAVVFSAWGIINHCQSAAMAEAVACLESLKIAVNLTDGNLLLETDCSSLLKIFDPGSLDRSPTSLIAKEFHMLKPHDRIVNLAHFSRQGNGVAHNLAQHGRRVLCSSILPYSVPECVSELVLQDCKNSFFGF